MLWEGNEDEYADFYDWSEGEEEDEEMGEGELLSPARPAADPTRAV